MRIDSASWILLTSLALISCAAPRGEWPSSRFYVEGPGRASRVDNSLALDEEPDRVWRRLVARVEDMQATQSVSHAATRRIHLTLFHDKPEAWIDCGRGTRSYRRGREVAHYTYPLAQSVSYKSAGSWRYGPADSNGSDGWLPRLEAIDRQASIRADAIMQLHSAAAGVRVDVSARYQLTVEFAGTYRNEDRRGRVIEEGPLPRRSIQHVFITNQWNTYSEDGFPVRCQSTGQLERDLLTIALP